MLTQIVLDHFASQASSCDMLGSPFTARLCRLLPGMLDMTTRTGARIAGWPGNPMADALALRLTGGLHALVLRGIDTELARAYPPHAADDGVLADALGRALRANDGFLHDYLDSPPQTNETARSAMLLPGFLMVARETGLPLAVSEIGASAGLNLVFDRFRYDFAGNGWGPQASAASIAPEVRGGKPVPLAGALTIASRAGCDIAPVDLATGADRLRSYIWADQSARLARLNAAIDIARAAHISVESADAAAFLRRELAGRRRGEAFVLFHSIMWQYMPEASKRGVLEALAEATATATPDMPIARLRMEPLGQAPHAKLSLTTWPGGETRRLANCDYHGRWIEWL